MQVTARIEVTSILPNRPTSTIGCGLQQTFGFVQNSLSANPSLFAVSEIAWDALLTEGITGNFAQLRSLRMVAFTKVFCALTGVILMLLAGWGLALPDGGINYFSLAILMLGELFAIASLIVFVD